MRTRLTCSLLTASLFLFILLLCGSTQSVRAQGWAVEVGPSYDLQHGSFIAPCGCNFANGAGLGYVGAISYDVLNFAGISVGARVGMDMQNVTAHEADSLLRQIAGGDQEQTRFTFLTIDPYIRARMPGSGVFLQLAPGFEYLVTSSFNHIAGSGSHDSLTVSPTSPVQVEKTQVMAKLTAGYSFGLFGVALEPMVTATLPLTDLSTTQASNWHISAWYASLAVRFGM